MAGKIAAILTISLIFVVVPVVRPAGPAETAGNEEAGGGCFQVAAWGWNAADGRS